MKDNYQTPNILGTFPTLLTILCASTVLSTELSIKESCGNHQNDKCNVMGAKGKSNQGVENKALYLGNFNGKRASSTKKVGIQVETYKTKNIDKPINNKESIISPENDGYFNYIKRSFLSLFKDQIWEGSKIYSDGGIYKGMLKNGKKHGLGTYTSKEKGISYKGSYKDGEIHGFGIFTYEDATTYKGEWVNGYKHGEGIYEKPDGYKYEGSFDFGKRSGYSIESFKDGVYKGFFKNDLKHGAGVYEHFKIERIEGEWENGNLIKIYKREQLSKPLPIQKSVSEKQKKQGNNNMRI